MMIMTMKTTTNIFVNTFRTSMGIYNRFFLKDGKVAKYYPYLPYKKISDNEYIVKPDLNVEPVELNIVSAQGQVTIYDENKNYINVFQNNSKENNVMNYDKYGFPIFDDEYEDEIKTVKKEEPEKVVDTKKDDEETRDKFSLF